MRTTFAAEPRSFDWHCGFNTKPYAAQPFPPIAWELIPASSSAIKWCDGVFLTWASKQEDPEKPAANAVGFLAERLGHGS